MTFTPDHPFYEHLKAYPVCFGHLKANESAGLFSAVNHKDTIGYVIAFTKTGALVLDHNSGARVLDTDNWTELEPYVQRSEYVTYKHS